MTNYNRENRSGGSRNFGKPRFNNDRPEMYQATCATCGKACEVPFRPNGSKPVYCRDCFKNAEGSGSDSRRSENRSFDRPRSEDRQMYDAVCSNCGDKCQIPFRPTQGRDVFCSRCFDMASGGSDSRKPERRTFDRPNNTPREDNRSRTNDAPNYKAQFEALNVKMDTILALLNPSPVGNEVAPLESAISEEAIDEIVEEIKEEEKEVTVKKPRKAKTATKESAPKAKKKASPKKK